MVSMERCTVIKIHFEFEHTWLRNYIMKAYVVLEFFYSDFRLFSDYVVNYVISKLNLRD